MTALARGAGQSGAQNEISGTIPIYGTWTEDINFFNAETGAALDISEFSFEFQFRCHPGSTSADVTLSTASGTLSIEADDGGVDSILRISAPAGTFNNYDGDMIADLVMQDTEDSVFLYGHGFVSFRNNPVAFT